MEPIPTKEVGFVLSAQDYLLFLTGLPTARINDIVVTQNGGRGLVQALDKEKVEVLMLDAERPKPGDLFQKTDKGILIPDPTRLLGRAINPLGEPIDGKGKIASGGQTLDLDKIAPGIDMREKISQQFITGVTIVDTLLPIGRGQRELLFGESRSGKTSFLLDLIVNQKGQNTVCVYNAIGRSDIDIQRFIQTIEDKGAADYTVVIAASSSQAAPLIFLAPTVACFIAENYRDKGLDVMIILDDLGTHSKYLREIGLLAGRIPGRESYPADIFYQHSHLVEKAGNFNENLGGGSITLFPVVETEMESYTNLITTNIMSMTDGHLLFSASLRAHGQYPAIESDRSVTRVGRQTQPLLNKTLADRIRLLLSNFRELERFSSFGSELTAESQLTIKKGNITVELLRQEPFEKIPSDIQIILLTLIFTTFFDNKDIVFVRKFRQTIISVLKTDENFKKIAEGLKRSNIDELVTALKDKLTILENACKETKETKVS